MKYCVNYTPSLKADIANSCAELRFDYYANKNQLIEVLFNHQQQKINVFINNLSQFMQDKEDLAQLTTLYKTYKNFSLAFTREELTESRAILINNLMAPTNIPFYFELVIGDWEYFNFFTSMQISEIFIGDALGFSLKDVRKRLRQKKKDIKVRVYPNVAQSPITLSTAIKKFFIRPEDMGFYQGLVDVCEFYGDVDKNNIYYKIYAKDKKWLGSLHELILDFNTPISNPLLTGYFAIERVNCGKRCLKGEQCRICEASVQLTQDLIKAANNK